MKNIINFKFFSFLFLMGVMVSSCVKDDDFSIPELNAVEPNITANFSIQQALATYGGFEPVEIGAGSSDPLYIEAYVISSDETGNYYKQLIIQDAPENPTAGVSISTEATDLYTRYEPGRKIFLRVDGLYVGKFAGLPTIGTQNGAEVGRINVDDFYSRIFRSLETTTLVPRIITIAQANSNAYLNTLIQLENVQFESGELGQSYGNPDNTFGVNRTIEDCDQNQVLMRNSGFADFKSQLLPEGNGTLTAISSVFNSTYQLFIRDTSDVQFTGERCTMDPIVVGVVEIPFMENFEGQTAGTGENVNIEGWSNVNVNGGGRRWEVREFSSNKYAQATAFGSNENPFEVWLITPGLNLPGGSTPTLNFDTKDGFNNGAALTVSISTDYNGDITTATWTALSATIATGGPGNGYAANFTNSGNVDLSAYAGQVVFVRFKYAGSSSGTTTTYQVDNVSVAD